MKLPEAILKAEILIVLTNESDYELLKSLLKEVCLFATPDLDSDYMYVKKIGVGS
jgi:hypothetical protein